MGDAGVIVAPGCAWMDLSLAAGRVGQVALTATCPDPPGREGSEMAAPIRGWTAYLVVVLVLLAGACGGGQGEVEEPAAAPSAANPAASEPAASPSPASGDQGDGTYVVESGDTLWSIAERFDTTVEDIVEANDLDDPDVLNIGDELVIPQSG